MNSIERKENFKAFLKKFDSNPIVLCAKNETFDHAE